MESLVNILGNDGIVIDTDEWDNVLRELESQDTALREMMKEFIETLEILSEKGFKSGERHKNIEVFTNEMRNIYNQMDGIYDSAKSAVMDYLVKESPEKDDFKI